MACSLSTPLATARLPLCRRYEYHGPLAAPQQSSEGGGSGSEEEGKENASLQ